MLEKMALPAFVWVEIQASTVKVDRRLDVLDIAEPPRRLLHPLDRGVHGLQAGVGEPVPEVGQDVREVALDQLGHRGHGSQPTVGGAPEPAGEERLRGPEVRVRPELAEPLLQGPRPGDFEIAALEAPAGRPLRGGHGLRAHEPEILRPGKPLIVGLLQRPVLSPAHRVHRVIVRRFRIAPPRSGGLGLPGALLPGYEPPGGGWRRRPEREPTPLSAIIILPNDSVAPCATRWNLVLFPNDLWWHAQLFQHA